MTPTGWIQGEEVGAFVVTGAQLISKGKWPKTILHLRLLFVYLPNCTSRKTEWAAAPEASHKSGFHLNLSTTFTFTQRTGADALNSGVYPEGPPVPPCSKNLLKYVDVAEVVRGPHDTPGHWLVTAAKLVTDGGKIDLHVKFSIMEWTSGDAILICLVYLNFKYRARYHRKNFQLCTEANYRSSDCV